MPARRPVTALLCNIALAYILYMISRVAYIAEFWDIYGTSLPQLSWSALLAGSLRFDTAAICYTNALYALLLLLPLSARAKNSRAYGLVAKTYFVAVNALMLAINLADTVYSRYTGRRTTWTFFSEFGNEANLGTIFLAETLRHWYLVLLGLAFLAALLLLYTPFRHRPAPAWRHYTATALALLLSLLLSVAGIRGGFSRAVRPIAISNANQYVAQPQQAAIVLNTPFSLIRTCGKTTFADPAYLAPQQLAALYSPIHQPVHQPPLPGANVVVLIVESFGTEYWGFFNQGQGHTPFLDSLAAVSLTFPQSFANGRKSIDAMPSVLSSIPMFVEPFVVTPYGLNQVGGLAAELRHQGYTTAFFHGADNGSMGFQAFARTSGFQHYYGRTQYQADPRFGGSADFDGTWAIWDEEFLQYFAAQASALRQPFCAALFTATSHHPFVVPQRYRQTLRQPGHPIHTCVRYTDLALRRFFAAASRQPWFRNTVFVITADHTNHSSNPAYANPLGIFRVPILIYDPSGRLPRGTSAAVAQQIDIMPTLLGAVGSSRPYVAFGQDLLHTPDSGTWAVQYNNGLYQYLRRNTLIQYDGSQIVGRYNTALDPQCRHNLPAVDPADLPRLQAVIQSYMLRMVGNRLTDTLPIVADRK